MSVPNNVLWFQTLLYLSLMLDAVSVAFGDRTPTSEITEAMITVNALLNGGVILLLLYFVHLAAQHRKNWPRFVLAAVLLLSVISLIDAIWTRGVELDSGIEIVSCVLTSLGLYLSWTGDAKGWFNA